MPENGKRRGAFLGGERFQVGPDPKRCFRVEGMLHWDPAYETARPPWETGRLANVVAGARSDRLRRLVDASSVCTSGDERLISRWIRSPQAQRTSGRNPSCSPADLRDYREKRTPAPTLADLRRPMGLECVRSATARRNSRECRQKTAIAKIDETASSGVGPTAPMNRKIARASGASSCTTRVRQVGPGRPHAPGAPSDPIDP